MQAVSGEELMQSNACISLHRYRLHRLAFACIGSSLETSAGPMQVDTAEHRCRPM
jgi:hypothetical protein